MKTRAGEKEHGIADYLRLYTASFAGLILNPILFFQSQAQGFGQLFSVVLRLLRGSTEGPQPREVQTPFEGRWKVLRGGTTKRSSHSWDLLAQRYAYDFVVEGDDGRTYRGEGRRLDEYHAYGRPVLAPADGAVVRVVDGIRDHGKPGTGWVDWRTRDLRGNHIVIEHEAGVYSLIAHIQPGSFEVGEGDRVTRGQPIGRCGNSGNTTEPHIHFQLQDRRNFFLSLGIPIRFENALVERPGAGADRTADKRPTRVVEQGDYVEPAPSRRLEEGAARDPEVEIEVARIGLRELLSSLLLVAVNVALIVLLVRFVIKVLAILQR